MYEGSSLYLFFADKHQRSATTSPMIEPNTIIISSIMIYPLLSDTIRPTIFEIVRAVILH